MKITLKENQMPEEEKKPEEVQTEVQKEEQKTEEQPKAPSIEEQFEQLKQIAGSQARMIENLTGKLEQTNTKIDESNRPAAPTKEQLNARFVDDPVGTLRDIMTETVKPLYEFKERYETVSELDTMKNKLRADPKYKKVFDVGEAYIDAAIQERGGKVDLNTLKGLALGVAGAISLGEIPGLSFESAPPKNNNDTSKPKVDMSNIPPHLRPSAPPAPRREDNAPQLRPLSELEERLRREQNLTHADYLALIDLRPDAVVTSEIAKAK